MNTPIVTGTSQAMLRPDVFLPRKEFCGRSKGSCIKNVRAAPIPRSGARTIGLRCPHCSFPKPAKLGSKWAKMCEHRSQTRRRSPLIYSGQRDVPCPPASLPPSAPCRLLSSACGEPIIPEICERSPFDSLGILAFLHDYSFSYPHLFRSPTVQQPLSTQVSYRLWQTRCVPQCDRACEHVARCWADASLQDIATNGAASMAATTTPKTKDALISFSHSVSTVPNVPA